MPLVHALVLGIVQGLTEFLPISSSGHLLVVPWLFGWNDFDNASIEKAFDVALHLGTLVAVIAYFRRDLTTYMRDGVKAVVVRRVPPTPEGRMAWLLVLASVPAAFIGAVFGDVIDEHLGKPVIIGASLIVFGVVLAWADRRLGRRELGELSTRDAVIIGVAQAVALNPGTSRSGITISAARSLGFDRAAAARFSFLLSVPVTAGAVLVKGLKLAKDGLPEGMGSAMIVGIAAAAVSGWLAVAGLLRVIRTRSFDGFVAYRIVAGVAIVSIAASSWR